MTIIYRWIWIGCLLAGCMATGGANNSLVVWHSLDGERERAALDRIITRFVDIYENTDIIMQYIERDELLERYRTAAEMGLGPNLMLGSSDWVLELARAGLIADLTTLDPRTDIYYTRAISALRYEEGLYGLPFSLHLEALYYNREMVDQPPDTLSGLLDAAAQGDGVAMSTRFADVFWGVQAFGGSPFDESGRTILDQGGFANWLSWLSDAQNAPGMFLERDLETLVDLFTAGRVAYLVGTPQLLPELETGVEQIGVTVLPDGPGGAAGPLLSVDAWMLNPASSESQTTQAMLLAAFMTNTEQGGLLVREADIVPANRRVRVDDRIYPAIHGFREQVAATLPLPNLPQVIDLRELGDNLIVRVLEGIVTPNEAAQEITTTINVAYDYAPQVDRVSDCELSGTLVVWHDLIGRAEDVLEGIADDYTDRCPEVDLSLVFRADTDEISLLAQFREEVLDTPDVLLGNEDWTFPLAAEDLIQPIQDDDALQQYRVRALEPLTIGGQVYGVPLSLHMVGLYYNPALIEDVATSTEELQAQLEAGVGLAMPVTFEDDYWGYSAFGGTLSDEDGHFVFDQEAWLSWLTWLETVADYDNVYFAGDDDTLRPRFAEGDVAYYIGAPEAATTFESVDFAVTALPDGVPVLDIQTFFINRRIDEDHTTLAQDFVLFATSETQQQRWLDNAGRLPANVNIVIPEDTPLRPFAEQIPDALVLPPLPEVDLLQTNAGRIMRSVIRDRRTPQEGVIALAEMFGITITFDDVFLPTVEATPESAR